MGNSQRPNDRHDDRADLDGTKNVTKKHLFPVRRGLGSQGMPSQGLTRRTGTLLVGTRKEIAKEWRVIAARILDGSKSGVEHRKKRSFVKRVMEMPTRLWMRGKLGCVGCVGLSAVVIDVKPGGQILLDTKGLNGQRGRGTHFPRQKKHRKSPKGPKTPAKNRQKGPIEVFTTKLCPSQSIF